MDRKLASIQRILEISIIEGADKIDVATILGWKVVIEKNRYKVNDLVVFCEVDSLLQRMPWNEFLFKPENKSEQFRLKTIRLRKQLSQGIIFPLNILPEMFGQEEEGMEVTEVLGITKYEPYIPAQLQGLVKGNFPSWIPKTDEVRIQSCPGFLERHKGKLFYCTEKLDGSSMTVYLDNGEFGVCSRNFDLKETEGNAYWQCAKEYGLKDLLETLNEEINASKLALQGELIGSIQGNKYKQSKLSFKIFNIYDGYKYIKGDDMYNLLSRVQFKRAIREEEFGVVFCVPLIEESIALDFTVEQLIEMAKGKSVLNPDIPREGLVFRCKEEGYDKDTGRLSFKVINNDFLEEFKE